MLTIFIGAQESYDEVNEIFVKTGGTPVRFEHSLVSLSKWESKHLKPFLGKEKTEEEIFSYLECMLVDDVPSEIIEELSEADSNKLSDYMNGAHTATTFRGGSPPSTSIITSELIYHAMFMYQIPLELEHWHLNRLFTLIRVFEEKSPEKKKKTPSERAEWLSERERLNEQRLREFEA